MDRMLGKNQRNTKVEQMFVRFRMLRKRALYHIIEKLTWQLHGGKAEL